MDILSIVLFALGAIVGVLMLMKLLKGHNIPKGLTLIHGAFVVSALLSLIVFNIRHPDNANWTCVVLFIIVAMGGGFVLLKDLKHQKIPMTVVFIHGTLAIISFGILVIDRFTIS